MNIIVGYSSYTIPSAIGETYINKVYDIGSAMALTQLQSSGYDITTKVLNDRISILHYIKERKI